MRELILGMSMSLDGFLAGPNDESDWIFSTGSPDGDRELMAAFVSKVNGTEFCIKAHLAVAERAYGDGGRVSATLADLESAPIGEPLRATLKMLGKLAGEGRVDANDVRAVLAAGASRAQIEDALAVGFAFNVTDRLADAFAFAVPGPRAFHAGAKFLLSRGYR